MPWISSDDRQGALDAVRHLITLGHRRIAHIAGPEFYLCTRQRLAGYRAALQEAQIAPDSELEVPGDFTVSSGREASARLFTLPQPPTAIFAANDDMARGVLIEARHRGLRVPEDVAVVGFDDAESSAYTRPPLTYRASAFLRCRQAGSYGVGCTRRCTTPTHERQRQVVPKVDTEPTVRRALCAAYANAHPVRATAHRAYLDHCHQTHAGVLRRRR